MSIAGTGHPQFSAMFPAPHRKATFSCLLQMQVTFAFFKDNRESLILVPMKPHGLLGASVFSPNKWKQGIPHKMTRCCDLQSLWRWDTSPHCQFFTGCAPLPAGTFLTTRKEPLGEFEGSTHSLWARPLVAGEGVAAQCTTQGIPGSVHLDMRPGCMAF